MHQFYDTYKFNFVHSHYTFTLQINPHIPMTLQEQIKTLEGVYDYILVVTRGSTGKFKQLEKIEVLCDHLESQLPKTPTP